MTYSFQPAFQLYSVRDQLLNQPEVILRRLRKAGYQAVEGFDLIQLQQIKPILDDLGFSVKSSFLFWLHVSENHDLAAAINYPWLPDQWGVEYEIERAQRLGLDTLVLGYLLPQERQHLDQYKALAEKFANVASLCEQANIQLLYHNHAFEFELTDGVMPYFYWLDVLQASPLGFELDVFWAQVAGFNPEALMAQIGHQLKQLHLKNGDYEHSPLYDDQALSEAQQSYSLGAGKVNIAAVVEQAKQMQLQRVFVEQEYSQHDIGQDLINSLRYLRTL